LYVITEYQYQQLRNTCKEAFVDEIGRQPIAAVEQRANNSAMPKFIGECKERKFMNTSVPTYLQNIIKKIDDAIESARKSGSGDISGLLLARLIITQETNL